MKQNILIKALIIDTVFTGVDFLFHQIPYFNVPGTYFFNKFLVGYFLILIALNVTSKKPFIKSLIITLLLQTRYIFLYDAIWNGIVILAHTLNLGTTFALIDSEA